jgi:enamine deaminase RidA (YjgF/YER057c/UK114 family)
MAKNPRRRDPDNPRRRAQYHPGMDIHARLSELGLTLPAAPKPVAAYVPAVRSGNLVYVSGQLPMRDGKLIATGPVPSACSPELAQEAARQCVLNGLAVVGDQVGGDFSRVVRVVRVGAFVQSDAGWTEQPKVANGGSELLQQVFGDAGRHARAAVGTNALPLGASVEIELLVEVR